jgi:protocatechuate 3,4-dioxygenase beta subunit
MNGSKLITVSLVLPIVLLCLLLQVISAQEKLVSTPADYEGPFYPINRQNDEDNDLIHVAGSSQTAEGDILNLTGIVVNTRGEPQKNVTVEIWQTDPQGRYNDPRDKSPGRRDPNFQYWGKALTGVDGTFSFKTLLPGYYPPRPAHIHFKVWVGNALQLTSQMYFINHPAKKGVAQQIPGRYELQVIELKERKSEEYDGFFKIIL